MKAKIPQGFNSWLQFYDYIGKKVQLDFLSVDIIKYHEHQSDKKFEMKVRDLKAKCFDELNSKRISRDAARQLHYSCQKEHYSSKDNDEILSMIDIMTK